MGGRGPGGSHPCRPQAAPAGQLPPNERVWGLPGLPPLPLRPPPLLGALPREKLGGGGQHTRRAGWAGGGGRGIWRRGSEHLWVGEGGRTSVLFPVTEKYPWGDWAALTPFPSPTPLDWGLGPTGFPSDGTTWASAFGALHPRETTADSSCLFAAGLLHRREGREGSRPRPARPPRFRCKVLSSLRLLLSRTSPFTHPTHLAP